jgi:hypothetical protein
VLRNIAYSLPFLLSEMVPYACRISGRFRGDPESVRATVTVRITAEFKKK